MIACMHAKDEFHFLFNYLSFFLHFQATLFNEAVRKVNLNFNKEKAPYIELDHTRIIIDVGHDCAV